VIAATPAAWWRHIFVLMLTGLWWGEFVAAQWTDLNLDAGRLAVWGNIPAGTHESKTLRAGPNVSSTCCRRRSGCSWTCRSASPSSFSARAALLNYTSFYRHVWRVADAGSELQPRIHDLRHAYVSLLLAFERDRAVREPPLGHSSAKLTLDTYGPSEEGHRLDREPTLRKLVDASHDAVRTLSNVEPPAEVNAETDDQTEAGDRTRTDDLRITRAPRQQVAGVGACLCRIKAARSHHQPKACGDLC
jgi:integrase